MREFAQFVTSFCTVCAVTGGLYIVFPNGRLSKSVKYIVTLCIITAFLGIFALAFKLNVNVKNNTEYKTDVTVNEEVLKSIFTNALKNNNINFSKISVFTDKNENGDIIISKVTVYTDENEDAVKKIIGNEEYEVEIINE